MSTGGVTGEGIGLLAPNGLNCEKKFVPGPSSVGAAGLFWKYKNPKNPIIIRARIIIKSVEFLFDIKYYGPICQ